MALNYAFGRKQTPMANGTSQRAPGTPGTVTTEVVATASSPQLDADTEARHAAFEAEYADDNEAVYIDAHDRGWQIARVNDAPFLLPDDGSVAIALSAGQDVRHALAVIDGEPKDRAKDTRTRSYRDPVGKRIDATADTQAPPRGDEGDDEEGDDNEVDDDDNEHN